MSSESSAFNDFQNHRSTFRLHHLKAPMHGTVLPFPMFNDSAIGLSQNVTDYSRLFKDKTSENGD